MHGAGALSISVLERMRFLLFAVVLITPTHLYTVRRLLSITLKDTAGLG